MSLTYSLIANSSYLQRSDGWVVPDDANNADYRAYLAWLAAGNTPAAAAPPQAQPNSAGFQAALKTALGGILPANALMAKYPAFLFALGQGVWADVQTLLLQAKQAGDLTAAQYAAIQSAASANAIPVTLP